MALASQVQSDSMQLNMEENTFPPCVPLASAAIFISTSVNVIAQSLSGTVFASKVTKATNGHLLNAPSLSLPIFLLRPSSRQEAQRYLCPEAHLQFSQVFPADTPLGSTPGREKAFLQYHCPPTRCTPAGRGDAAWSAVWFLH